MYSVKQILVYGLLSFLLSLIITTYYLKKPSNKYYLLLVLLFFVFYLFFYLINLETSNSLEQFNNYSYYIEGNDTVIETVENEFPHMTNHLLAEEEEEEHHIIHHELPAPPAPPAPLAPVAPVAPPAPEEEEHVKKFELTGSGWKNLPSLSDLNIPNIGIGNPAVLNSVKGNTCSPVNVNIYNGEKEARVDTGSCPPRNRNLGDYNSRVYNNSDWIYGNSAWTNAPDFYIPRKNEYLPPDVDNNVQYISQKVNEVLLRKKFSDDKNVCPMMVNTPWSEYLSGDKQN
jgi:hypothetical protein